MESSVLAPAIVIAVTGECSEQWRDVLLGIEEEGIPFVLQPQTDGDLVHHAWQAAQRSPLQVGIACRTGSGSSCTTKIYPHQLRCFR